MITNDIIALIKIIIDLASKKGELDKDYFEQFIQPAWEAFVKVHEAYKASLTECIELSRTDYPISSLYAKIHDDSFVRAELRVQLSKLLKHMPSAKLKTKEKYFLEFVLSMVSYFNIRGRLEKRGERRMWGLQYLDGDMSGSASPVSRYLIHELLTIDGVQLLTLPSKKAERILEDFLITLQQNYGKVADSYYHLRKELLT